MIDRSNPDAAQIFRDRYEKITEQYREGVFSEVVLRATLHGLGYGGARLEDEIAYQRGLRGAEKLSTITRRVVGELSGLSEPDWPT